MKSLLVFWLFIFLLTACGKNYLQESPSNLFATPDDLARLNSLLSNDLLMGETPVLGEESADDYYLLPEVYNNLSPQNKNTYTWQANIFQGKTNIPDYNLPYSQVFTCNLVLDALNKINPGPYPQTWNETKGCALFMRSYAFFNLAQIFADAYYDSASAKKIRGISLPFSTDINIVPPRSYLQETYDQIVYDLNTALPLVARSLTTRHLPAKPTVFALLARVHLSMRNYPMAYAMADSCIRLHDSLLDFNTLNKSLRFPIQADNKEILYQSWLSSYTNIILGRKTCMIDSTLYSYYSDDDVRKEVFFMMNTGRPVFKNNGTGKNFGFSGLSISEMYLIRSECAARLSDIPKAMDDLNKLQEKRYKPGTFTKYVATTYQDAMTIILRERRKELIFRGLRWADIKRLNKEEAGIVLTRLIEGQTIQLLPKNNRYILPLPDDALSGGTITQNIRD